MASKYENQNTRSNVVKEHNVFNKSYLAYTIGEELPVKPEDENQHDQHVVAVMKNGENFGHLYLVQFRRVKLKLPQCRLFVLSPLRMLLLVGDYCHVDIVPRPRRLLETSV